MDNEGGGDDRGCSVRGRPAWCRQVLPFEKTELISSDGGSWGAQGYCASPADKLVHKGCCKLALRVGAGRL